MSPINIRRVFRQIKMNSRDGSRMRGEMAPIVRRDGRVVEGRPRGFRNAFNIMLNFGSCRFDSLGASAIVNAEDVRTWGVRMERLHRALLTCSAFDKASVLSLLFGQVVLSGIFLALSLAIYVWTASREHAYDED